MHIVTLTCPNCGTVVAGNLLVETRSAKCPGVDCDEILRLEQLSEEDEAIVREQQAERS
jgi:hypothetical protein